MKNISSEINKLDSIFPWVRNNAFRNLVEIGSPAVKEIFAALDTRYAPYNTHGYNQDSLSEANRAQKRHPLLVDAVVKIGKAALPELEVALRHPNLNVRVSAMTTIARIGHPSAVDLLLPFLDSSEYLERESAVYTLASTRSSRVFERIVAALDDKNLGVRESAILALGDFGDASVLPKLEQIAELDKTMVEAYGRTIGHVAKDAIEKIKKRDDK
jgi:HEAT repeat protein